MADFETKHNKRKKSKLRHSLEENEASSQSPSKEEEQTAEEKQHGGRLKKKRKTMKRSQEDEVEEEMLTRKKNNLRDSQPSNLKLRPSATWRNLDLVLSLQSKQIHLQRKVETAFDFIKSIKLNNQEEEEEESNEMLSISRLVVFLNDWIQSQLISSAKKVMLDEKKPHSGVVEARLDYRCWEIFKFCLEGASVLRVSLSFTPNLLHALSTVVKDALSALDGKQLSVFGEGVDLYSRLLDCALLLLSTYGRVFNANMELWASLVILVVDLVRKIYSHKLADENVGDLLLHLSFLVLEPFSNFLRVHPSPKNIFPVFVDKVLEPGLNLLVELSLKTDTSSCPWTRKLLKVVEEILSNGLFHPAHIDGFLSTHSMEKYVEPSDRKVKKQRAVIKSYHRHFFQKLEKIMADNVIALSGVGELFHLFVVRVKKQKGVSVLSGETKIGTEVKASGMSEKGHSGNMSRMSAENRNVASRLDADTSRALFDLFVYFMEPLNVNLNRYSEDDLERILHACSTLKSINKILFSLMQEKIYTRTEDDSEGERLNFLKDAYQTVMSFSAETHLNLSSSLKLDDWGPLHMLPLVAKEILISLGYFLEIEYEVVANDLASLWLLIIMYSAIDLSLMGTPERCLLTSEILQLGCQLIDVYSELRQVDIPIFALCKAIRLFGYCDKDDDMNYLKFLSSKPSFSIETCVKSVAVLLCSQQFRIRISSAIKSIPEGQASGCIRQLKKDISESLEWIKLSCSRDAVKVSERRNLQSSSTSYLNLQLQAELLGIVLSEIYTLILDCSTVTTGNCILVGSSLKDLLTVVRPSLSRLVVNQPDNVNEFLLFVTGRRIFNEKMPGTKHDAENIRFTTPSILVFFFRLYISCRSLYREAISFMPPDLSRKTSTTIGDLFTACIGRDWIAGVDWIDGGYFSWIVNPSDCLPSIIKSVSDIYLVDSVTDCAPLVYVLHVMILQRLVDLNRQIKAFEFLHERAVQLDGKKLTDDSGLSVYYKETKKCKKHITVLREEAVEITSFLTGSLPLMVNKVQFVSDDCVISDGKKKAQDAHEDDEWDLSICSLTRKLLPTAIWWILCQNTDVWCVHATKNNLKKFLSCLLHYFSFSASIVEDIVEENTRRPDLRTKVTLHQISLELLIDTVFHEQSFLCRHLTSRFCHFLEKSVLPQFSEFFSRGVDLKSLPDWPKVLRKLDRMLRILSKDHASHHETSEEGSNATVFISPSAECRKKLTACQNMLNLLSLIPKVSKTFKSFSVCSTHILNLERLVVLSLLHHPGLHNCYELFRTFVCCRKTLKCLIMSYCEENIESKQSLRIQALSESSFSVLWLLKSVFAVVHILERFPEEHSSQVRHLLFSLMDNTSYVLLMLSKNLRGVAFNSLLHSEASLTSIPVSGGPSGNSVDSDISFEFSENSDAWKVMIFMAETLKEQTQSLFVSLRTNIHDASTPFSVADLNKVSSMVSCIQGYCWGLASVIENIEHKFNGKKKPSSFRNSELNLSISVFENFIKFCLHALLVEEHQLCGSHRSKEKIELLSQCQKDDFTGREDDDTSDAGDNDENWRNSETNSVKNFSTEKKKLQLDFSILTDVNSFERQKLNKSLLRSLLTGKNPELAFSVRQLFIASSAILRLKLQISDSSSSLMSICISTSQFLLSELAEMVEKPHPFSFVWLDGVLKYIEVLGSYISSTDPTMSTNMYARLINIHLKAIGKCISLQGKGATLASHESESSTKTLIDQTVASKFSPVHGPYSLDEFKARLRMSFRVLIKKPFESHLVTAIQALERALVGVNEACNMIYEITTGGPDGGEVSSVVAAGVDCLDLLLESLSGRKHLNLVKKHIQSLVGALFNIVLHLHSPHIFCVHSKVGIDPDAGSIVLMCVELLTKVAGKHTVFQLDQCHVGQALRMPASLFQTFCKLKYPSSDSLVFSSIRDSGSVAAHVSRSEACCHFSDVDQQFSVDLFAACCRLLCTVLRHHRSESASCIFLLIDSVNILLHCLETVNTNLASREGYFTLNIQGGAKSASFLRRIYEEIRHQKEVLGPYCSHFLSNYISVYSGYGPLKTGIRREVDEALRPGVYALIDACSPEDLQYIHTVLGEGPCRSTLANLQHDYKLNFQYGGKV